MSGILPGNWVLQRLIDMRFALAICACLAAIPLTHTLKQPATFTQSYATAVGARDFVTLQDGTRMFLNTDSKVLVIYGVSARNVHVMSGEAFFDVADDPGRPFRVAAGDRLLASEGTQFDVYASQSDVGMLDLGSGEQTEFVERAGRSMRTKTQLTTAEIESRMAWREGQLIFDQTPLSEVVAQFNRYSTRKLVIADPSIAGRTIRGTYRTADADTFADGLSAAADLGVLPSASPSDFIRLTARHDGVSVAHTGAGSRQAHAVTELQQSNTPMSITVLHRETQSMQ
jgi:ferric-dicitrate binding protein FerR (iron transport regulator)